MSSHREAIDWKGNELEIDFYITGEDHPATFDDPAEYAELEIERVQWASPKSVHGLTDVTELLKDFFEDFEAELWDKLKKAKEDY